MLYLVTERYYNETNYHEDSVIGVYISKEKAEAEVKAIIEEGRERAEICNKQIAYHHCEFCYEKHDGCRKCFYAFEETDDGYRIVDGSFIEGYILGIKELHLNQRIN